jgi:transposase
MKELPDLKQLTEEAKDALIVLLWEEIQKLQQGQQKKPKKTATNSSVPPAQGFKPEIKTDKKEGKRIASLGRAGGGRPLHENPDQIITAELTTCAACGETIPVSSQQMLQRYDKIDLPPIAPIVTRVERYGCVCSGCGSPQLATVPTSLEPGSPFGPRIMALITTMRYSHGISYSRMKQMLGDVFGLDLSQGAIANLLSRVKTNLASEVEGILKKVRTASWLCSDETSARVDGKNQWEWVFQNDQLCLHVIRPSRGADVIAEVMGNHQPEVWVSDLYSAQKTHPAVQWQVCLAHQLRDCQYGIDAGDQVFSTRMKAVILRSFVIQRRWPDLTPSTRYQYRCRLYRDLESALALCPIQDDGIRLRNRYLKLRENLFLFLDDPRIPATNNSSEQAIRWSVIFRKITNGFRSEWGRDLFASVRSIVNTGKRQGLSALDSIIIALDPLKSLFSVS